MNFTYMMGQAGVVHVNKLVYNIIMRREAGDTQCLHHSQIFQDELSC